MHCTDSAVLATFSARESYTGNPKSLGCTVYSRTSPFFSSPTIVSPDSEISSMPLVP